MSVSCSLVSSTGLPFVDDAAIVAVMMLCSSAFSEVQSAVLSPAIVASWGHSWASGGILMSLISACSQAAPSAMLAAGLPVIILEASWYLASRTYYSIVGTHTYINRRYYNKVATVDNHDMYMHDINITSRFSMPAVQIKLTLASIIK